MRNNEIMEDLHLNLKGKWFDMILSGEKKEEYREIKKYWVNRLVWDHFNIFSISEQLENFIHASKTKTTEQLTSFYGCDIAQFKSIIFSNGYSKNRRQFVIELKNIEIKEGKPEWGAEKKQKYFVLNLGKITHKTNC